MRSVSCLSIRFGAAIGIALALCFAAAAKAPEPVKPSIVPPMRIVVVKGNDAGCSDACPEWISAEGEITSDTLAEFRKVLKSLGSRKLPVFVKSNGGSVEIAMTMGRLLRARHLDVAVTQTIFEGCAPTDPKCARSAGFKGYRGTPTSALAFCASACSLLLAGGERRFVAWGSYVGVHEITMIQHLVNRKYQINSREENGKKIEVSRTLVSEKDLGLFKFDDKGQKNKLHEQMAKYFAEMGVNGKIMDLTRATKPEDIHWMTRDELRETNMLTNYVGGETLVAVGPTVAPVALQAAKVGVAPAHLVPTVRVSPDGSFIAGPPETKATPNLDFTLFLDPHGKPVRTFLVNPDRVGATKPGSQNTDDLFQAALGLPGGDKEPSSDIK